MTDYMVIPLGLRMRKGILERGLQQRLKADDLGLSNPDDFQIQG